VPARIRIAVAPVQSDYLSVNCKLETAMPDFGPRRVLVERALSFGPADYNEYAGASREMPFTRI
jgi:hypothetical protein